MSGKPLRTIDSGRRDIEGGQAPESHQPFSIDDISEAWEQYPEGYPRFAAFIAHDDDKSTTIFRRFERLAARNLLYLESELFELEAKQDKLDEEVWNDAQFVMNLRKWEPSGTTEASQHETYHQELASSSKEIETNGPPSTDGIANSAQQQRLEVAYSIRRGIKEYYKALKLYHEVLTLDNPNPQALTDARITLLNNYLSNGNSPSPMLQGRMASHLDGKYKNDLCLAGPAIQQDSLATMLEELFEQLGRIFGVKSSRRKTTLFRFPRRYIQTLAAFIGVSFFAAMFLGSLVALMFMRDTIIKLALISIMTIFLALSTAVFTRSSRVEISGAIIGYLLITTLFVGNSQAPYEGPYEKITPLLEPILALNESTNNSTSVVTTPTLTAIEILGSTGTTTPSDQPSVTLANASSKATIIGTVIAGIALVFTIVAGVYQCRKWMKKRRTKKAIAP